MNSITPNGSWYVIEPYQRFTENVPHSSVFQTENVYMLQESQHLVYPSQQIYKLDECLVLLISTTFAWKLTIIAGVVTVQSYAE